MVSKSKWETFFKEAGIPSHPSANYATTFCDNRIQLDMLQELNKEVLNDLGIQAVGDVIAIIRYAKLKHAELSRHRSPSPEVIETPPQKSHSSKSLTQPKQTVQKSLSSTSTTASTVNKTSTIHRPVSINMVPCKASSSTSVVVNNSSRNSNSSASKITVSSSTKTKYTRKTLSDRFNEFEKDAKRKKQEEEEEVEQQKQKEISVVKQKSKGTLFTIQLPSKPPVVGSPVESRPQKPKPQKITLVPAQGKTLNRNKQSTSIFDRLGNTSDTASTTPKVEPTQSTSTKQNVFKRLGGKERNETLVNKTLIKVQKVSAVLRQNGNSAKGTKTPPNNVFNRLGDR